MQVYDAKGVEVRIGGVSWNDNGFVCGVEWAEEVETLADLSCGVPQGTGNRRDRRRAAALARHAK